MNSQAPTQYIAGKIYQGLLTYGPDLKPRLNWPMPWEDLARWPDLHVRAAERREVA
ncbi:hypothetical protein ACU4GD_24680 [Cupriavidus basilensis]